MHVKIGKTGPEIPIVGLGCMGMSAFYSGHSNDEESIKVLNRAIDIGCTFWDTADMYGPHKNEELIAKVLKERRNEVFICTKFAIQFTTGDDGQPTTKINGKPEYVKQACEASLKRLGIDQIDLYYQHRVDPNTPIEETVKAMAELVKEGKVKYLGLSEASAATIRRAHAVHPITAYQVEYSPWSLDIETNGIKQTCEELGITIVAYSPLGRGFLTGEIRKFEDLDKDDWRRFNPRFQPGAFEKNLALVDALKALAAKKGVTVSQLTLAWVAAQGDNIVTIPGTTKIHRLEENFGAMNVKITKEDGKAIRDIIATIPIEGTRYPAAGMAAVNL